MSLFKRKRSLRKEPGLEAPKILGVFTVKNEFAQILSSAGNDHAQIVETLNKNQSVYIIEDVNEEYFKVVSRYKLTTMGYISKAVGTYVLISALPYRVVITGQDPVPVYDRPTENGTKVGLCQPKEVYHIAWEWDNFGKMHDKPYWINLDNTEKLKFK